VTERGRRPARRVPGLVAKQLERGAHDSGLLRIEPGELIEALAALPSR
jgi:hypothetical protein